MFVESLGLYIYPPSTQPTEEVFFLGLSVFDRLNSVQVHGVKDGWMAWYGLDGN